MKEKIKYPVKYAVLELKEKGGWISNYKDITRGFVVSKCYILESSIVYNKDGSEKIIHKVVFPFDNINCFKLSLREGIHNIGLRNTPSYDAYGNPYPVTVVNDLYDSYDEAKNDAKGKNEEFKANIMSCVSVTEPEWESRYKRESEEFDNKLSICELYEQLAIEKTNDMTVTFDKEKSYAKVLKQDKNN